MFALLILSCIFFYSNYIFHLWVTQRAVSVPCIYFSLPSVVRIFSAAIFTFMVLYGWYCSLKWCNKLEILSSLYLIKQNSEQYVALLGLCSQEHVWCYWLFSVGTLRELESVLHVTSKWEIYCDRNRSMFSHRNKNSGNTVLYIKSR